MMNNRMRGMRSACRLLAAAAFAVGVAAPAFATATISPSGKYEDSAYGFCNTPLCVAQFSLVPLGKTLIISSLACRLQTIGGIFSAYLASTGSDHNAYFFPTQSTTVGTRRIFLLNTPLDHIATSLTRPRVKVTTLPNGKAVEVDCTINGRLE